MNILEKIKYTYMFIYLVLLISSFIIISLKITYCVLPLLNEDIYAHYGKTRNGVKLRPFIRIIPYCVLGIVVAMGIYSLLDNTMLIKLSSANL